VWARRGSRLFYRSGDALKAVDVSDGPRIRTTAPATLFRGVYDDYSRPDWPRNYDVAPDGRFLMVRETYTPKCERVVVVLNWRGEPIGARR
jgi:hypothetical protein